MSRLFPPDALAWPLPRPILDLALRVLAGLRAGRVGIGRGYTRGYRNGRRFRRGFFLRGRICTPVQRRLGLCRRRFY